MTPQPESSPRPTSVAIVRLLAVASICLQACAADTGFAPPEDGFSNDELVGGELPPEGEFLATVVFSMPGGSCSGTKVGPDLILTAAHCVSGRTREYLRADGTLPDLTFFRAGERVSVTNGNDPSALSDPANRFVATRTFFPAGWREACEEFLRRSPSRQRCAIPYDSARGRGAADIALIEVDRELTGIPTAPIDFRRVAPGETLLGVGYGRRRALIQRSRLSQYPDLDPSWIIGEELVDGVPHVVVVAPQDQADPRRRARRFARAQVDPPLLGQRLFDDAVSFTLTCEGAEFFAGRCAVYHRGDSGSPLYRESSGNGVAVVAVASTSSLVPAPLNPVRTSSHFRTSGGELEEMLARAGHRPVGEVGRIVAAQSGRAWTAQGLRGRYDRPVVVMGALSFNGSQPAHLRARRVTPSGFEWQIEEWGYLDGGHTTETNPYLVMEAGAHRLEDGTAAFATTVSVDHRWTTVSFGERFSGAPPVLLVGVMSDRERDPVVVRVRGLTARSAQLRLDEEEAADGVHAHEIVGVIALAPGSGESNGRRFIARTTPDAVTDRWYPIRFAPFTLQDPILLGNPVSTDGLDAAGLRFHRLGPTGAIVRVEEEKSRDEETAHTTERVSWLAFEAPGVILRQ